MRVLRLLRTNTTPESCDILTTWYQARKMSSVGSKKPFGSKKMEPFLAPSVWTEFVGLTIQHNAVNLGQGFPDYPPPPKVKAALAEAVQNDFLHQYTRGYGHIRLVKAIAELYGKEFNREIDAMNEVLVTTGAYESLYCIINGLVTEGDEVIVIEPFFDCYSTMVSMTGARPVFVPLHPPEGKSNPTAADWKFDIKELSAAFTDKTKLILLNTPNNPLGKVFTRDELMCVADLCKQHDVICLADEVYEWMVYEPGYSHIRIATLPDMWERTVTVCSAGKTFNTTGWKLGWTIGPQSILRYPKGVHQNCVYTNATLLQEAVGAGLEYELSVYGKEESYFHWIKEKLKASRNELARCLRDVGFAPHIPEGGYFIMADYSSLPVNIDPTIGGDGPKDFQFVRWLIKEKKLTAIPVSAFYSEPHKHIGENFLRFCFIKDQSTLDKAEKILKQWKSELKH